MASIGKLIYDNPLQQATDVRGWVAEGGINQSFQEGLILASSKDASFGDHAHFTYWLPEVFPKNLQIEWEFLPIAEPGLCMMFFSALGKNGESIFNENLAKRDGFYPQYHSGDLNAYHISYFRHKHPGERAFRTCNLRKSAGFHFITQGGDPLPDVKDATDFYQMKIMKRNGLIQFYINDLAIFSWQDDGQEFGPVLEKGYIGLRQMAPMVAKYRNLKIYDLDQR